MSASQTIHLIEKLTEANIPKETAMELLEYVERQQADLVTKDYLDIKIEGIDTKIESLDTKINALKLFIGFNTALSLAIIAKLFLG